MPNIADDSRCAATTQRGTRCTHATKVLWCGVPFCWLHSPWNWYVRHHEQARSLLKASEFYKTCKEAADAEA